MVKFNIKSEISLMKIPIITSRTLYTFIGRYFYCVSKKSKIFEMNILKPRIRLTYAQKYFASTFLNLCFTRASSFQLFCSIKNCSCVIVIHLILTEFQDTIYDLDCRKNTYRPDFKRLTNGIRNAKVKKQMFGLFNKINRIILSFFFLHNHNLKDFSARKHYVCYGKVPTFSACELPVKPPSQNDLPTTKMYNMFFSKRREFFICTMYVDYTANALRKCHRKKEVLLPFCTKVIRFCLLTKFSFRTYSYF